MSDLETYTDTEYAGLFGALCRLFPPLDVRSPGSWALLHRSYERTVWGHQAADVWLICERESDRWSLTVVDRGTGGEWRVLPQSARRWNAFSAAGDFLDGEPLLIDSPDGGLVRLDDFRE